MFKGILISVVVLPVLLGMVAGRIRRESHALLLLLGSVFIFDVLYLLLLYYLRIRWVG
jgi:hypothetical protein